MSLNFNVIIGDGLHLSSFIHFFGQLHSSILLDDIKYEIMRQSSGPNS